MIDFSSALRRLGRANDFVMAQDVQGTSMPNDLRARLDHTRHMTQEHQRRNPGGVALEILALDEQGDDYLREVLLRRSSDGEVLQYAILSVDKAALPAPVAKGLRDARIPFGQVLADHHVARDLEVLSLLEASVSREFHRIVNDCSPAYYGRRILIRCNGKPAISVLELLVR